MAVILIKLSTGDVGVVVNREVIMTADPAFEAPEPLEFMAAKLANAIDLPLMIIATNPPATKDWTWDDVVQTIPGVASMAATTGNAAYAGYLRLPGSERIQIDFEAPHGATKAETDLAFLRELGRMGEINYLSVGEAVATG